MLTLGSVCGFATFYEMRHGTPAAQRDIYQTPWFAGLLFLLGTNVLAVMVSRYPWTKHHIGFLAAHVGILAILVGSVVSLYGGLDSQMAILEGETSDRVTLLDKALQVSIPATRTFASFPVAFEKRGPRPGREQRLRVPDSELVLVADGYEPHVTVSERYEPAASGPAALHLVVQAPMATQEQWLAADAAHSSVDFGMVSFALAAASKEEEARRALESDGGASHLRFVAGPGETLRFSAGNASGGAPRSGIVTPGEPIATGWPGLAITVDRFLPAGALARSIEPATPPAKEERRRPAVRLHLESPSARGEPQWVPWGEQRSLSIGDKTASISYRPPAKALPFRVTLLRFNNESYPGSSMAATYESTVRVDDPEQGPFEALISMNHPLHYRGYIFFQSSFVEGRPMMSVFSVARAPGLPLVYLGTSLMGLGIVWMFYVKPYLAKRQAAQALAARRARENPNEAKLARPVPAGAPGAEPSPRGA